jgi:hypothetical protein
MRAAPFFCWASSAAGKSYFCEFAFIGGAGVRVADGDQVVAARKGWLKGEWWRDDAQKAEQHKRTLASLRLHAAQFPAIPVLMNVSPDLLPSLRDCYSRIIAVVVPPAVLQRNMQFRVLQARAGGEHKEWADYTPDKLEARYTHALEAQANVVAYVDTVYTSFVDMAKAEKLYVSRRYFAPPENEGDTMPAKFWGTIRADNKVYAIVGEDGAVEAAKKALGTVSAVMPSAAAAPLPLAPLIGEPEAPKPASSTPAPVAKADDGGPALKELTKETYAAARGSDSKAPPHAKWAMVRAPSAGDKK